MGTVKCPYGNHQIEETAKICPICGRLLADNWSQTRTFEEPDDDDTLSRFGTSYFNAKMTLHLRVRGLENAFSLDADTMNEIILGRGDPSTGEKPAVDLTAFDAISKGVSRRHAQIFRREDNALHLIDLDSANGTYLNGQRMIPKQARILRNGDEIRLGRLVLEVEFTRKSAKN